MSQIEKKVDYTTWNINGLQLQLDMQDAVVAERYEAALAALGETEKNLPKTGTLSERIRAFCSMFRCFFDHIFGEGTAQQIFGDSYNAREHGEVYENFLEFVSNQRGSLDDLGNRLSSRYSPNRAQRRAISRVK